MNKNFYSSNTMFIVDLRIGVFFMDELKKENLLNEGLVNIGYTLEEAIMEAIDDALDAKANYIQIRIIEEIFNNYKNSEVNCNNNMARRCSYLVCDNGTGIEDIGNIFNFGNKEQTQSNSKVIAQNGRFRYGNISHINVGTEITFYSKTKENKWQSKKLNYDRSSNSELISDINNVNEKELEVLRAIGIKLPENSGTVLYVRGVLKTELDFEDIGDFRCELIRKLGITYLDDLYQNSIFVDNLNVRRLNPICEDLTDEYIKPTLFGYYKISLDEILFKLDDNIAKEELFTKFSKLYKDRTEMLRETIEIKLIAINKNFTDNPNKVKEKFPNLDEIYYPKPENSGFYIKRNKRYIGKALGMLGIVAEHPVFNRFRGEISFNPIFDDYFKIQINKNKNNLSKFLINLIQEKIMEDNLLKGGTVATKIKNALGDKEKELEVILPENILDDKKSKLKAKFKSLKRKLESCFLDTQKLDELELLLHKEVFTDNELHKIYESYAQLEMEYKKFYTDILKDAKSLVKRISLYNKTRQLSTNINDIPLSFREPLQEGEMFGVLCILCSLFPDKFDFHICDYKTDDGLDCLIKVNSQLYNMLNFNDRFGVIFEKIRDNVDVSDLEIDLKMK